MIDKTLIIRKINLISKDLKALEPLIQMGLEPFLQDQINEILAERYLERIIGRMIDINYHLITELDHPPPKDYFESFIQLGKLKILPHKFATTVAQAAGLRNRLVHEYNDLDEEKIYEALHGIARDVPRYLEHIYNFIRSRLPVT